MSRTQEECRGEIKEAADCEWDVGSQLRDLRGSVDR